MKTELFPQKMKHLFLLLALSTSVYVVCFAELSLSSNGNRNYEEPQVLKASKILPADVLSGPNHKVEEHVKNDGFLNHYTIKSNFGDYKVISTFLLKKRVHEISVIQEMTKIETSDIVKKSLKESGKKTISGIKNLFSDPEGTLEGAGKGIGNLFGRAKESFRSDSSQAEDSRAEQFIGFSKSKREIAAKLGVDVYSANTVLQEQLERLAWADYAGGIGVSAGLSVIPGGAGLVLSTSGAARLLNDQISATPPSELRLQNRQKLVDMDFNADTIELFINNTIFSPRDQTWLVASLEKMNGTSHRELFLKVALQVNDRTMALLIAQMTMMYAGYHKHISPIDRFYPVARVLYAQNKKGEILLIIPADYVTWNERFSGTVTEIKEKMKRKSTYELWTIGNISSKAKDNLSKAGWGIHTNVLSKLKEK